MERTTMWCPHCNQETLHKVLPEKGSMKGVRNWTVTQRFGSPLWKGFVPRGFLRTRKCQECQGEWPSIEIPYFLLKELVEFYERLGGIGQQVEKVGGITEALEELATRLREGSESMRARLDQIKADDWVEILVGDVETHGDSGHVLEVDATSNLAKVELFSREGKRIVQVPLDHLRRKYRFLNL